MRQCMRRTQELECERLKAHHQIWLQQALVSRAHEHNHMRQLVNCRSRKIAQGWMMDNACAWHQDWDVSIWRPAYVPSRAVGWGVPSKESTTSRQNPHSSHEKVKGTNVICAQQITTDGLEKSTTTCSPADQKKAQPHAAPSTR